MREHFVPSAVDLTKRIHILEFGGKWYARTPNASQVCTFWPTPRGDWGFGVLLECPRGLSGWKTDDTLTHVEDLSTVTRFLDDQQRYFKATEL